MKQYLRFIRQPISIAIALIVIVLFVFTAPRQANAAGLQIAPTEYKSNLSGKVKNGAVDVTNRSAQEQKITIEVKAFKQVDSKGSLKFYDDPLITEGIIPDLNSFKLKPDQTEHLIFQINGKILPKQQLFVAILARAEPIKPSYNITPILRVGTLLFINNGNKNPAKHGEISDWKVSVFQLGNAVTGDFAFKNTEAGDGATGFFPEFTLKLGGEDKKFEGNLVFPGIKRQLDFRLPGSRIGIYKLELTSDADTSASQWVIVITGYWRWLLPLIVVTLVMAVYVAIKLIRHKPLRSDKKPK